MNFYMPRIIVHHKQICSVFQHEKICSLFLPWPFWKLSYRYEWLLWIHTLHRFYIHVLHHSARDRVSHHTDCHAWSQHFTIPCLESFRSSPSWTERKAHCGMNFPNWFTILIKLFTLLTFESGCILLMDSVIAGSGLIPSAVICPKKCILLFNRSHLSMLSVMPAFGIFCKTMRKRAWCYSWVPPKTSTSSWWPPPDLP